MSVNFNRDPVKDPISVTIIACASATAEIDMGNNNLFGFQIPAAWTSASAGITFQACPQSDGTFNPVYDEFGTEITFPIAVSTIVLDTQKVLAGLRYIKVNAGTNASPVVQTATRTLNVLVK